MALQRVLRQSLPVLLLGAVLGAAVYATRGARLEPADFVFNNGTEVQTLDPATVTGVPEGRAIRMVYEGLLVSHPETLEPLPGMAERWEVSQDRLTYTFHLRQNALWSNGDTVDADDFMWSFERFLDPRTAAEYAYMLWYVTGAKAFTTEVEDGRPRNSFDTVGIERLDRWTHFRAVTTPYLVPSGLTPRSRRLKTCSRARIFGCSAPIACCSMASISSADLGVGSPVLTRSPAGRAKFL